MISLNGFLAFLLIIFVEYDFQLKLIHDYFWIEGVLLTIGILLIAEIGNIINNVKNYKFSHPVRLAGMISFMVVVLLNII